MAKNQILYRVIGLLVFILALNTFYTRAQELKPIQVTGKIQFLNPENLKRYNWVWLKKGIGDELITIDSVLVNNDGFFNLKFTPKSSGIYQLDILKWQSAVFFADNDIKISARGYDTAQYKSKNSGIVQIETKSAGTQLINMALYNIYIDNQIKNEVLNEGFAARKYNEKDTTWYSFFKQQRIYQKIEAFEEDRLKKEIQTSLGNPASIYLISILNWERNFDFIISELNKLIETNSKFEDALNLKKEVIAYNEIKKKVQKGGVVPVINYENPAGTTTSLSSFKGKYVIVDFWASWCGPCRKSIPKLKALYSLYKDKGLDILSVSIDTDKSAWKKAMAEEEMPWHQVISPNKDKTMKDFMIQGVPTLFLLDRDGKVIEKFTGYSPHLDEILKNKISE